MVSEVVSRNKPGAAHDKGTRWTEEKIKALHLPEGKTEQRMLIAPGLYLYVRKRSGGDPAKQWQFRAQVGGVRRWLSLGTFPVIGLAAANAELLTQRRAQEAAKKGEADHPAVAARFARKAAQAKPTVTEVFDEWLADKRLGSARKGGLPVRDRTVAILRENFNADIRQRIGDAKVAKLTRDALQQATEAEFQDWCRERMAGYKRPRSIVFIGDTEMPRTATGKIVHRTLRERMLTTATA